MSVANGLSGLSNAIAGADRHELLTAGLGVMSIVDNLTLTLAYRNRLRIAPDAARDVILPAVATSLGAWFELTNFAAGAFNLVVKDALGATIVTINQNERATVYCDGVTWYHTGVITVAQS